MDSGEDRGSTPLASSLRFWSAAQKAKAATPERSVGGLLLKLPPDAQKDYGLASRIEEHYHRNVIHSDEILLRLCLGQ